MSDRREERSPYPPARPPNAVTDEDRNRYGVLLDRAAERGLLGPDDYEVRLRELAAASSVEQMNRIVTELPVFSASSGPLPRTGSPAHLFPTSAGTGARDRTRTSPWLLLVIVVAVIAASLLFLSLYAGHVVRDHNSGLVASAPGTMRVSALRL